MTPDYIHRIQHLRDELASLKSAYERNRDALQGDLDYMLRSCDHRRADGASAIPSGTRTDGMTGAMGPCAVCRKYEWEY